MSSPTPQSLLASFTQRFCCQPMITNDNDGSHWNFPSTSDMQELSIANGGCSDNTRLPDATRSQILAEHILIPTLDEDGHRRFVLKPRYHIARELRRQDTSSSSSIIGPPTVARFSDPWIVFDQEMPPKTPVTHENRPRPYNYNNNNMMPPIMPEIPSLPPIETIEIRGGSRSTNLAPRVPMLHSRRGHCRHY